jgi:hypothetical protein
MHQKTVKRVLLKGFHVCYLVQCFFLFINLFEFILERMLLKSIGMLDLFARFIANFGQHGIHLAKITQLIILYVVYHGGVHALIQQISLV